MFNFFKHLRNVIAFNQLDPQERQIVFYSEGKNYWVHLKGMVEQLLAQTDITICYVSSSANDPGLHQNHHRLLSFLIDESWVRNWWFENLQANLLVLSMPDLHQYQVKRSKYPVHYIYVQHSLVSKHMVYRKGAFDYYDSIFCAAPHHLKEIRALEKQYGLPPKDLYQHGYSRLDSIIQNAKHTQKNAAKSPTHVLIAPSWGSKNITEAFGLKLVNKLLAEGFVVTLRPHPQTVKYSRKLIDSIVNLNKDNPKFFYEYNVDGESSLHDSDIMISDWSGAALDYAFGLGKPVLFIDVPKKINNEAYEAIKLIPFEESIRTKIGAIMPTSELDHVAQWIKRCLMKKPQVSDQQLPFNMGQVDKIGAELIMEVLHRVKTAKREQNAGH